MGLAPPVAHWMTEADMTVQPTPVDSSVGYQLSSFSQTFCVSISIISADKVSIRVYEGVCKE